MRRRRRCCFHFIPFFMHVVGGGMAWGSVFVSVGCLLTRRLSFLHFLGGLKSYDFVFDAEKMEVQK